jgi:hypothetical protein
MNYSFGINAQHHFAMPGAIFVARADEYDRSSKVKYRGFNSFVHTDNLQHREISGIPFVALGFCGMRYGIQSTRESTEPCESVTVEPECLAGSKNQQTRCLIPIQKQRKSRIHQAENSLV